MSDAVGSAPLPRLSWRRLAACDLPELAALYARALAADGGQPFAADEWLVRRWFIEDVEDSRAALADDRLAGACAWRFAGSARERHAVIVGLVDPEQRRRGIGGRLLDVALDGAGIAADVRVETESLGPGADALYRSRGLTCVFAEDVMTRPLADSLPEVVAGADVTFTEWSDSVAERFFAVYEASFRDRPGFPGWTAAEWIRRISGDDEFRADWTLLASRADNPKRDSPKPKRDSPKCDYPIRDYPKYDYPKRDYPISGDLGRRGPGLCGADVGFVVGGAGGWLVQVGVVPGARRQAVASTLIVEVLRRMRAGGETRAVLDVNVNNPGAIAAYLRLGFRRTGRRARYEPARLAAPWQPR
jgi:mycothiol synthase